MTYEDRAPGPENTGIKRGKLTGPDYPHIPNKSERKLLAKMMQASGLTENQLVCCMTVQVILLDLVSLL